MRLLTTIIICVFVCSCGNDKAEIIERIRAQKDSLIIAEMTRDGYASAADHVLGYKLLTGTDSAFLKKENYTEPVTFKSLDSVEIIWEYRAKKHKHKIDSLELELKKY